MNKNTSFINSNLAICALFTVDKRYSLGELNKDDGLVSPQRYAAAKELLTRIVSNNGLDFCPIYPIVVCKGNENSEKGIVEALADEHMLKFSHLPEPERSELADICANRLFAAAFHHSIGEDDGMRLALEQYLGILSKASKLKEYKELLAEL